MDASMRPEEGSEQVKLTLPARLAQFLRRRKPVEMPMSQWLIVMLMAKTREDNLASELEGLAEKKAEAVANLAKERAAELVKLAEQGAEELVEVAKRRAKELAENALCLCGSGKTFKLCCGLIV